MDVATRMSSGKRSVSPLWGEGDDGVFFRTSGEMFQFYFHIFILKREWAFNMQLRIRLSVNRSLMSCCFCSLWEGLGIIKHLQWVPRRQMTGSRKFFIINKKESASPLTGNFNHRL